MLENLETSKTKHTQLKNKSFKKNIEGLIIKLKTLNRFLKANLMGVQSNECKSTSFLQEYGHVLIVDRNLKIVGISEDAMKFSDKNETYYFNSCIEKFYNDCLPELADKHLKFINQLFSTKTPKQIFVEKIKGQNYYFDFTTINDLIYIEWEQQFQQYIPATKMTGLGFLFESQYFNDWDLVCETVGNWLEMESVVVFKVQDHQHLHAISEYNFENQNIFYQKTLSNLLYSERVIEYYQSLPYRYNPDLKKRNQKFFSINKNIDSLPSKLKPAPIQHFHYLQHIGINAFISYPLFLDRKLWGALVGYSTSPTKIDKQSRKICSFIVQNAMRQYENIVKETHLSNKEKFFHVNTLMTKRLQELQTPNCALAENMELLTQSMQADGMAIYHHGDVFNYGLSPNEKQLEKIILFLQKKSDKRIFKDYNFRLNREETIGCNLPFAGLIAYCLDTEKEHYAIWFRKESVSITINLKTFYQTFKNSPEHISNLNLEEEIKDSAIPWGEDEIYFLEGLHQMISESIIEKNREQEKLTESLKSFNNELEMLTYTLSHDLKNHLSILKMGLQFLRSSSKTLPISTRIKWHDNMLESIESIKSIIDNIMKLSRSRSHHLQKEPTPMVSQINRICKEACLIHKKDTKIIQTGTLLPIWGEKSALHQIFLNLITNAIKYSSFHPEQCIKINSYREENLVVYIIEDNGIGIPEKELSQIFSKFVRASNADRFRGTGIGLALVKRVLERLDGEIDIQSEENYGTRVTLKFPVIADYPTSMIRSS